MNLGLFAFAGLDLRQEGFGQEGFTQNPRDKKGMKRLMARGQRKQKQQDNSLLRCGLRQRVRPRMRPRMRTSFNRDQSAV